MTGTAVRRPARRPARRLRVAISGSAGTGKTTLGQALADRLDLPFLPEPMRARLEGGFDLHDVTLDQLRDLILELYDESIDAMAAAEANAGGFIADRSPADFVAFWLYYRLAGDEAATEALVARVRRDLDRLDGVLLLPWGGIPLEDDGVRAPNAWLQLHFQALFEGLVARYVPITRLLRLPDPVSGLEDRLEWALQQFGNK